MFQQTYPALGSVIIVKSPLPPFDRAAVQRWWDNNTPKDKELDKTAGATTPGAGASVAGATLRR